MGFLDYSSKTSTNIIPRDGFQELVMETFSIVSDIMAKSLGPLGSTTMILDGQYTSVTKDGFTIFKNIKFANRYKAMIYNLIRIPCTKLNNTVGDGTTTAVVAASYLFEEYMKQKERVDTSYRLPREFLANWDEVIDAICYNVASHAEYDSDSVAVAHRVAMIASNGNTEIANNIRDVYSLSKSPVIRIKDSPTNKSYIEREEGFHYPSSLIDTAYTRSDDLSTTMSGLRVLLFTFKVDADMFDQLIMPLNEIYRANDNRLLVIAPAYDGVLMNGTVKQYLNGEWTKYDGKLNLIFTQYLYKDLYAEQTEDLAALLNCVPLTFDAATALIASFKEQDDQFDYVTDMTGVSPMDPRRGIGLTGTVRLTVREGTIFTGLDTLGDDYKKRLLDAEGTVSKLLGTTALEKQAYSLDIGRAYDRLAQLKMENYLYYVGADSTLQISMTKDAIDDVIKAVRSAVSNGTVPGCQLAIITACAQMDSTDPIIGIIRTAMERVYRTVLEGPDKLGLSDTDTNPDDQFAIILKNSLKLMKTYDAEKLEYSDSIITSVETDTMVLRAASELVKLLITGNQAIYLDNILNSAETVDV